MRCTGGPRGAPRTDGERANARAKGGKMSSNTIEILLVEDNAGDARLTLEAFKEGKVLNHLTVVQDGVQALAYLRRQGPYAGAKVPDLILLDLNLPRMSGREVLAQIKADERLKRIRVVVLTTSEDAQDIARAYSQHANCYIPKPVDLEQFLRVIQSIENFWLTLVRLPPNGAGSVG